MIQFVDGHPDEAGLVAAATHSAGEDIVTTLNTLLPISSSWHRLINTPEFRTAHILPALLQALSEAEDPGDSCVRVWDPPEFFRWVAMVYADPTVPLFFIMRLHREVVKVRPRLWRAMAAMLTKWQPRSVALRTRPALHDRVEWLLLLRGRLWLRTETFARLVSLPRVPAQTWQQAWLLPNGNGVDLWAASGVEGDLMKKDWAHPFFS